METEAKATKKQTMKATSHQRVKRDRGDHANELDSPKVSKNRFITPKSAPCLRRRSVRNLRRSIQKACDKVAAKCEPKEELELDGAAAEEEKEQEQEEEKMCDTKNS